MIQGHSTAPLRVFILFKRLLKRGPVIDTFVDKSGRVSGWRRHKQTNKTDRPDTPRQTRIIENILSITKCYLGLYITDLKQNSHAQKRERERETGVCVEQFLRNKKC